uniref:Major facilitator superfamily (MFS) profile domain-containing protein n=2 Tax=Palpitomonas bilix TaxID=652834 RepID=A0A7S3GKI0_9EUKA|mmetsp:Transcript_7531/g.19499  ORF Transcript_7531/g.19499 Transcript_7531/m.19499 type:complete len:181 (+) Transcript_7531:323-865(+)
MNRLLSLFLVSLCGACGCLSVYFVANPQHALIFVSATFIGIGQIGVIIASQSLAAEYARPDVRGAVSGMFSLWGGVGVLISSSLGGFLFDIWSERAPFFLLGFLNVITTLLALAFFIYFKKNPKKLDRYHHTTSQLKSVNTDGSIANRPVPLRSEKDVEMEERGRQGGEGEGGGRASDEK